MGAAERFQEALRARDDDPARREHVDWLQRHGGAEALAIARTMGADPDPLRRELAADVLARLAAHRTAARETLMSMVDVEEDLDVLVAIAAALGQLGVAQPLRRLQNHPEADVRGAATAALESVDEGRGKGFGVQDGEA
jgi:HEAT repeat protein